MTRDHTTIEELLAVRALGGLDGEDVDALERELASHGACEECDRLRDAFDETAGRLGLALEPMEVDPRMVDRILGAPVDGATVPAIGEAGRPGERRGGGWRGVLAVAASIAVLVGAFALGRATDGIGPLTSQRVVQLDGDEGTFALAYTPGEDGIVVWGTDLPDPGSGRVYELWTIAGGEPVPQGCLRPIGGAIAALLDGEIGDAEQVAVTLEASSCPDAPTSDPVFASSLA